jgi:hypothetical protein
MTQFSNERQRSLRIGISSYTDNEIVLDVIGNSTITGNLGIGTDASTKQLTISGSIGIGESIFDSTDSPGQNQYVLTSSPSGILWQAVTGVGAITGVNVAPDSANEIKYVSLLNISAGTTAINYTSPSNLTYNTFTNNLGIGTTNPTSKLWVGGDGRFTGVVTAASFSGNATSATYATSAGIATYATNAGIATYATSSGISSALIPTASVNTTGIITASQLSTGASGIGININANTISGPAEITIDPAAVGDNTGSVRVKGDLYVDGTQFIVNSTTIELADKNIGIATTVGTNLLLDGAGIGIGSANIVKTITWNNSASALTSSEDWNLVSGKQI